MKRALCSLLSALVLSSALCLSLSSCGWWDSFTSAMGFDTRDYSKEETVASRLGDEALEKELSACVAMLTMNEPRLAEFSSSSEAMKKCRDSVLNRMLDTDFARYTGDIELLDRASEEYPQIMINNLIPSADFDRTFYRVFGGAAKITRQSGEYFSYLEKLEAYTALAGPISPEFEVHYEKLDETENTYRITLYVTVDKKDSPRYDALMIKRDDGTVYFRSVSLAG
jgi:hypothetical protein